MLPDLYLGNFKGVSECNCCLESFWFGSGVWHVPMSLSVCFDYVRCKRPRTARQEQHHTHPVHSWQRGSHPPGEKLPSLLLVKLTPSVHLKRLINLQASSKTTIHRQLGSSPDAEHKPVWQVDTGICAIGASSAVCIEEFPGWTNNKMRSSLLM